MRPLALGSLRGDEGDAELFEGATKLRGLAAARELFVERPVLVVAGEDAAAIFVESGSLTIWPCVPSAARRRANSRLSLLLALLCLPLRLRRRKTLLQNMPQ